MIGGSASAQLVLQICTAQIPCPGFPLGSVQAGVDQNGWRNFKVTLTQNVSLFSIVGVPPPSQASVNVIFTQDATGGRTVTFASNITNPCVIVSAANATTLCQFEFDGVAGIWFGVLGGGLASLPTAAAGSVFASQGIGITSALQTKPNIDVRDFGVDCTDTTDSTTALASAISTAGNFGKIVFPANCKVKVSGTPAIFLHDIQGLEMEMLGRQGNNCDQANSSFIDYRQPYASGNTVLSILDSQRLRIRNLVIYANGNADNGILIDQDLSTPPITTDNIFESICIFNNTGNRNASWNGFNMSPTGTSNIESQRFRDIFVLCSQNTPTSATSNGNGFNLPQNSNAVNEEIEYMGSTNCSKTVNSPGGQELAYSHILDSTGTTNTNVVMSALNAGLLFSRFENGNIAIQQPSTSPFGPTLIMGNDFTNSATVMDCTPSGCGGLTTVMNNEKDTQPANWFNLHTNRGNSGLFAVNNRNFSWAPSDWSNGGFVFPDQSAIGPGLPVASLTLPLHMAPRLKDTDLGSNFGSPYIDLQSTSGGTPQIDDFYIQNMPTGIFGAVTAATLVFGHSPNNGVAPWYSFQGTISGVNTNAISNPFTPVITNFCTGGATTWTYQVVAHDGTGTTAGSATASTTTGCATLSSSNGNLIAIPSVAGCTFYDVYRTAAGGTPNTTGKIGQAPCYNIGILNAKPNDNASANTFFDTGLAGDSTTAPVTNTTGTWVFNQGVNSVSMIASGGTPTVSGTGACLTTSTQVGGKWAGLVTCTGATAASTLIITPGISAAHGFRCPADDETTNANKLTQSAQSTTTCTISGTVNANDVIAFGPIVAF